MTCLLRDLQPRECSCPSGTCKQDLGTFVKPRPQPVAASTTTLFATMAVMSIVSAIGLAAFNHHEAQRARVDQEVLHAAR